MRVTQLNITLVFHSICVSFRSAKPLNATSLTGNQSVVTEPPSYTSPHPLPLAASQVARIDAPIQYHFVYSIKMTIQHPRTSAHALVCPLTAAKSYCPFPFARTIVPPQHKSPLCIASHQRALFVMVFVCVSVCAVFTKLNIFERQHI